jgi:hypothetical protein
MRGSAANRNGNNTIRNSSVTWVLEMKVKSKSKLVTATT